jgi:hypothetical protein
MLHPAPRTWHSTRAAWWVAVACLSLGVATWLAWPPETVEAMMGETGPVERITAASYALCAAVVWLAKLSHDDWRDTLALSVVMACFCMRELDWHKAFTGTSVLRLSWYWGGASSTAKLVAAALVLSFAAALAWLLWRHASATWTAVLHGQDAVAVTVFVFVLALIVAKSLDRSVGILADEFDIVLSIRWIALRSALEEWLELSLSMLALLGVAQHRAAVSRPTGGGA